MEKTRINGPVFPSSSASNGGTLRSAAPPSQPNFNSTAVKEALRRLTEIDLSELCNEAKVEHCRATRDLRSCGRYVQYSLNPCGHASLCAECSQRCDTCPICRTKIAKGEHVPRLYDVFIDAGLISRRFDERFQDREQEDGVTADVQRLYSLFDVAMEINLVSLICHYVTDVCMDETAVSSDAVTAWLLDEKVVKDWVKWTFKNITKQLQGIYKLEVKEMKNKLGSLLKFSVQLAAISSVLEVLESSLKGSLSAQLDDLRHLQERVLSTKQHLEITIWCTRYDFLENVRSRYSDFASWRLCVQERKSAAIKRAWPDVVNQSADSTGQDGSLFIEDALANLEIEQGYPSEAGEELDFAFLQKDGALSFFRSKIEGLTGCYPFENPQAAVDILFLRGSSDLVVAKQAIFLYYLFDRHWTNSDETWRHIVDDFSATFGITRHSLLESFTFCLLDDTSDEAMQEAFQLLPEIAGPATHPKIAQVLLERQNPEAALMVLRWSGGDGSSQLVSLNQAVTGLRVRVECGLLTEAFTYQRMLCTKARERKFTYGPSGSRIDDLKSEYRNWVEILVTEFSCLCIRRNLVDRMIELPWNFDEEKYIHKCLLDYATNDPSATTGSLLAVFYLQRYRYIEAYQVNLKLWTMEEDFMSKDSIDEEALSRMESQRQRRKELVDKGLELLPEVQQQQVKAGILPDKLDTSRREAEMPVRSDLTELPESKSGSLLVPSTSDSIILQTDQMATPFRPSVFEGSKILCGSSVNNSHGGAGNYGSSSILQGRLFTESARVSKLEFGASKNFKFDDISTPAVKRVSPTHATPLKGTNWPSSKGLSNRPKEKHSEKITSEEQNGFINQLHNTSPSSPYSRRVTANPVTIPGSNYALFNDSSRNLHSNISGKRGQSDRDDGQRNVLSSDDLMDVSWGYGEKSLPVEDRNANGTGLRWRSDETSDEEAAQSPERTIDVNTTTRRQTRRSRFARR